MNNLKELFIAYLKENAIPFEKIGNQVIFEYKGSNLVASDFEKTIQIGKIFVSRNEALPTNADKESIKQYLTAKDEDFNSSVISRDITLDENGHIDSENLLDTIETISQTSYDMGIELLGALGKLAYEGVKFSLSAGASMLRKIANAIDPEE